MRKSMKINWSLFTSNWFFLIVFLPFLMGYSSKNQERVFLVIDKNSENIDVSFRSQGMFIWIKFDLPNYRANASHTPPEVNHWEYSHEEIEIGQTELINAQIFFANQLSFSDWSDLEKLGENQKIYVIFYDEYMNRDRFVWNHKFKAWEVRVTADGPI